MRSLPPPGFFLKGQKGWRRRWWSIRTPGSEQSFSAVLLLGWRSGQAEKRLFPWRGCLCQGKTQKRPREENKRRKEWELNRYHSRFFINIAVCFPFLPMSLQAFSALILPLQSSGPGPLCLPGSGLLDTPLLRAALPDPAGLTS